MDDLPQKMEIGTSRAKMIVVAIAGFVMTGGSALLVLRLLPDIVPGSYAEFIGYVGLIFFGVATALVVWRLLTAHGVVLTMDAEGLRDRRISDKVIPWKRIRNISTWQSRGQRIMIVALDPEFERTLGLSRLARIARGAGRAFGADGLGIGCNDLRTNYETMFNTATGFWKRNS